MGMTKYSNIIIAAGTVTLAYLMLKILRNKLDKTLKKDSETQRKNDTEEKRIENLETEEKAKSTKRKSEEAEPNMKIPRVKPNFFLGFQVYNVDIHEKVKKLQEQIVERTPSLHSALVNVSTLHVTLAVTHLPNEVAIKEVKAKLDEWAEKNSKSFVDEPITLHFTGIKTFNDIVAYVNIEQYPHYQKLVALAQTFNNILSSAGFSTDERSFKPHLTILKLSKDFKLIKVKKKFKKDFEFLKGCEEHFGKQDVSHIQLLSMDEPKDENGYYKCFHVIKFKESPDLDHSECCKPIPSPKKNKSD